VYPMLPVSLDCPFLICPSVFSNVYLFSFVLCRVCPMLPVSLDCPFLICPSGFSNVYLFIFVLCLVYPMLPVSLDCPFLICPSVFSNVYLLPTHPLHGYYISNLIHLELIIYQISVFFEGVIWKT
jgi:hypothetical protein